MVKIKKCKKEISRNLAWVSIGLILTRISVENAYMERGYMAYGGEWFTLPLLLMTVTIVRSIIRKVRCLFGMEGEYGPDED